MKAAAPARRAVRRRPRRSDGAPISWYTPLPQRPMPPAAPTFAALIDELSARGVPPELLRASESSWQLRVVEAKRTLVRRGQRAQTILFVLEGELSVTDALAACRCGGARCCWRSGRAWGGWCTRPARYWPGCPRSTGGTGRCCC